MEYAYKTDNKIQYKNAWDAPFIYRANLTFKFDIQSTERKGCILHELIYDEKKKKKRQLFHKKNF